jgi:hypothetical protein
MRTTLFALALVAGSVIWFPVEAFALGDMVARGTVTELGGRSITVRVGDQAMKFDVDGKTIVEARGGSTKARQASAKGQPGPRIDEILRVGQAVSVTYANMAGSLHASQIRAVPTVGSGGGSVSGEKAELMSRGVVKSIGTDSITIDGSSGGGASFTQTFTIDPTTKVVGKGAGTMTAMKGGKAPIRDLVANGDRVTIVYHKMGDSLHASDVRVTLKKASH